MCAKKVKKTKKAPKSKPKKASAKKSTTKKVDTKKKVVAKKSAAKKATKKAIAKKAETKKTTKKAVAKKPVASKPKSKSTKKKVVAEKKVTPPKKKPTPAKKTSKKTDANKAASESQPANNFKQLLPKLPKPGPRTSNKRPGERTAKNSSIKPSVVIKPVQSKGKRKTRYTDKELDYFRKLIDKKLEEAENQLEFYLSQIKSIGTNSDNKLKGLDDGTSTSETEQMYAMAARQRKYIQHLENAKLRIKNNIYGICRVTGNLISKERLKAVPHATLSIHAKLKS